jgi:NADPH:quinone reductase-like Zn-dependent oxidoreductase
VSYNGTLPEFTPVTFQYASACDAGGSIATLLAKNGILVIHTWDHLVEERRAGMRAVIEMLAAGKLHPRIHARLPLTEARCAHEMLESGAVLGKLLLQP